MVRAALSMVASKQKKKKLKQAHKTKKARESNYAQSLDCKTTVEEYTFDLQKNWLNLRNTESKGMNRAASSMRFKSRLFSLQQ